MPLGLWIGERCYNAIGRDVECFTDCTSILHPLCQHCFEEPSKYHIVRKDDINFVHVDKKEIQYVVFNDFISLLSKLSVGEMIELVGLDEAERLTQWWRDNR